MPLLCRTWPIALAIVLIGANLEARAAHQGTPGPGGALAASAAPDPDANTDRCIQACPCAQAVLAGPPEIQVPGRKQIPIRFQAFARGRMVAPEPSPP